MTKDPLPRGPSPPVRAAAGLAVRCVYCHDGLVRDDAVYCASCLAPHHGACFREHGRCSAPGCDEASAVRRDGPESERARAGSS